MHRLKYWILLAAVCPAIGYAGGGPDHFEPVASVILWVTLIFLFGVTGRYFAERLNQPGVLGELLMGVLLGNVCYYFGMPLAIILREGPAVFNIMSDMLGNVPLVQAVKASIHDPNYTGQIINALSGSSGIDWIKVAYIVDIFSRYGVIFLLFMVGLETSIEELKHTGRESFQVAMIGIVAPIVLGLLSMYVLMPNSSFKANLFIAATLSATSIGITARVLKEMQQLHTREARTILGAAMIDDILGLVILAIVSSIVISDVVNMMQINQIIVLAILFFVCALWIGPWVLQKAIRFFRFLEPWEAKLFISFVFVMFLAWLATAVQLATIIGAFAAGIIIHDGFFEQENNHRNALTIKELIAPLEFILVPLFFMLIGMQVKIELFMDWQVLLMASGLIMAAILGKLLSGFGGNRWDDRVLIGIGMVPRGEVGLVFASIGRKLGIMSDQLFSAIILMVIVTTLIAPPWFKSRYKESKHAS
ncbi:cation:proton antiporter [Legionella oakridgensis]|uniref:cation:proton antiporter n=1 Tax=Legionella oakridgensis TaxID=29423 RepID=UPI0003DE162F|nr:cation:proton antiporter [Legionella oakridgensis]ETO93536.1 sodium/proton antiporter NhaS3, CPA2 family [Legionella oakridgensis RV-2-2007]